MISAVFQGIIDKLNSDTTLQGYFGSTTFVYRSKRYAPFIVPSITVAENNEKSIPRTMYKTIKIRDNSPTVQIDIWVSSADESFPCTGEDADLIAEKIDQLLLNASSPVTGTMAGTWQKVSSSQQHEESERIWHNALRYSFQYSTTDT